jgi:hypothetical protein
VTFEHYADADEMLADAVELGEFDDDELDDLGDGYVEPENLRPYGYRAPARFDERDCSGVWDGFGVVSDADPGL